MGTITEDFLSATRQAMGREGEKLEAALADEVDTRGISDTGHLRKNFESAIAATGSSITLRITGVRYANYVAEGTSPGYYPPTEPIREWAAHKLHIPRPILPEITRKIILSIHKHGTPLPTSPQAGRTDYIIAALRRRLPDMLDELERRIARGLRGEGGHRSIAAP